MDLPAALKSGQARGRERDATGEGTEIDADGSGPLHANDPSKTERVVAHPVTDDIRRVVNLRRRGERAGRQVPSGREGHDGPIILHQGRET